MMAKVSQETLTARIAELETCHRSLKEDFALEAYRMLLPHVKRSEAQSSCKHDWWFEDDRTAICLKCGKIDLHG
ncbi:hypothetical protein [Citrobacter sedlakii]|uniref:hypothetical protein n=1 Tax=Citrobacter sedlakii TaxID=67826 RepID=UPI00197E0979|nr:hypothetical protein [Citrobacter sedlakii]MBN6599102.1 hypothetical protein [Citrobacter sedlakii]